MPNKKEKVMELCRSLKWTLNLSTQCRYEEKTSYTIYADYNYVTSSAGYHGSVQASQLHETGFPWCVPE